MDSKTIFKTLCLLTAITGSFTGKLAAQCTNTIQFPSNTLNAPVFNTPVVMSTNLTNEYSKIQGLLPNKTYVFSSSVATDFITVKKADNSNPALVFGTQPVTYNVGTGADFITVHVTGNAACGAGTGSRTITATCTNCDAEPPKVGVATTTPTSSMDVNGTLRVGSSIHTPQKGMIRWNDATSDFEGYNGSNWVSFTKSNGSWGNQQTSSSTQSNKLIASDGSSQDNFGFAVSISGNYAVVGAYLDQVGANLIQGSAYIFIRSGSLWVQQAKIAASDGGVGDNFGYSVSISGDYAVIGAPGNLSNRGAAYVFMRTGTSWAQQAKLQGADGLTQDYFGRTVSISGDYAIVGANEDDNVANANQGSAYVFNRTGTSWAQQAKLLASDGANGDGFGSSVSIDGDYAIVGAPNDDNTVNGEEGSAYVFLRTGVSWAQQQKILPSDAAINNFFGNSVSISGTYVAIGATGFDNYRGAAYVFLRTGVSWAQQAKMVASDGNLVDEYAASVSISGDYVIVGSPKHAVGTNFDQGAAYVYFRQGTSWLQQVKLLASDGGAADVFGKSVSISGTNILVGANQNDSQPASGLEGAAYYFIRN